MKWPKSKHNWMLNRFKSKQVTTHTVFGKTLIYNDNLSYHWSGSIPHQCKQKILIFSVCRMGGRANALLKKRFLGLWHTTTEICIEWQFNVLLSSQGTAISDKLCTSLLPTNHNRHLPSTSTSWLLRHAKWQGQHCTSLPLKQAWDFRKDHRVSNAIPKSMVTH